MSRPSIAMVIGLMVLGALAFSIGLVIADQMRHDREVWVTCPAP